MYHEHFGLHQAPFSLTPQTGCFHQGLHGPTLDALHSAILDNQGVVLVRGPLGTGKTMLCHMLVGKLKPVSRILSTSGQEIERVGLLQMLHDALEILQPDIHAPLRQLERRLREGKYAQQRIVLAIDDAQQMSQASLQTLNRLCGLSFQGRQAIQFVLFAEKSFSKQLAADKLRILRARIGQSFDLSLLNRKQVADYLQFRLSIAGYSGQTQFPDQLATLIARASRGMLKHINIIADKAMMAAFAENLTTVTETHVKAAIHDTHLPRARFVDSPGLLAASACALLIMAGGVTWLALKPASPSLSAGGTAAGPSISRQSKEDLLPAPATEQTNPPATNSSTLSVAERSEMLASVPDELGPAARALLIASRSSIDAMPDTNWFLQLRAIPAANAARLETFLSNAEKVIDTHQLALFVGRGDPQQTVLVIYGSYPTEQAAYADISHLPAWIRSKGIRPRAVKTLRQGAAKSTVASGTPANRRQDLVATH